MRGRKPIPTELHRLRGTLNATRHGKGRAGEAVATGLLGAEPPPWMTDAQQAGWRYAVEHAPAGLLKLIDRTVLAVWVEAEDRHRTASMMQAKLDTGSTLPLLTKTKDGLAASPYLGIMNRASIILIKAASELGFSPAARPRIPAGRAAPEDPEEATPWDRLKLIQGGKKGD